MEGRGKENEGRKGEKKMTVWGIFFGESNNERERQSESDRHRQIEKRIHTGINFNRSAKPSRRII